MRHWRIILLIMVASILAVGMGLRFLAGWVISGAFESSSGDLKRVFDVGKATLGATLARGDRRFQPSTETNQVGALEYYEKHPQQLQSDKAYFETWYSALFIAHSGLKNRHRLSGWASSADLTWIPSTYKLDAWGHKFCVYVIDGDQAAVMSPGPSAVTSLDCTTVKISQLELRRMAGGRLFQDSQGRLILFLPPAADANKRVQSAQRTTQSVEK